MKEYGHHQSQFKEKAQRFYHYRSAFRFLLPPGEGQDEGIKKQKPLFSSPHPSPLPKGEGILTLLKA